MHETRRSGFHLAFLFLLAGLFFFPGSLMAQGTKGIIAGPMGLREARTYLERYVGLTQDQWPMVESAHDTYLEQFEKLREGVIQKYIDHTEELSGGGMGQMPEIAEVQALFDEWKRVTRRIEGVDGAFFETIGTKLRDEQVGALGRAKSARARFRNRTGQMFIMGGGMGPDFETTFWAIQPTPEELQKADSILKSFEARMTRLGGKLAEAGSRSMLNMLEGMVEAGFGEVNEQELMEDPKEMQAMMEALPGIMAASTIDLRKAQADMNECEQETAEQLISVLGKVRAHQLFEGWGASSGSLGALNTNLQLVAEKAIQSGDLDDAQKDLVRRIMTSWVSEDLKRLQDIVAANHDLFDNQMSGGVMDPEFSEGMLRGMMDLALERQEAADVAKNRILAMVSDLKGAEINTAVIEDISKSAKRAEATGMGMVVGVTGAEKAWDSSASIRDEGAWLKDDLGLVATLLDLEMHEIEILDALHQDYLEQWSSRVTGIRANIATTNEWDSDDFGEYTFSQEKADRREAMIRQMYAETIVIDEGFSADLQAAFGSPERVTAMATVNQFRAFDRADRFLSDSGMDWGSDSGWIAIIGEQASMPNPYRLIEELDLEPEVMDDVMARMIENVSSLAPAIDGYEKMEVSRLMKRSTDPFGETDDEDMDEVLGTFDMMMEESHQAMMETLRRSSLISRTINEQVLVDIDRMRQLEFQVLFADALRAQDTDVAIEASRRVLRMNDLTSEQRISIEGILNDYLEKDAEFAQATLEVMIVDDKDGRKGYERQVARSRILEKIQFRRNEQTERLLDRLRVLLDRSQLARVPVLGDEQR